MSSKEIGWGAGWAGSVSVSVSVKTRDHPGLGLGLGTLPGLGSSWSRFLKKFQFTIYCTNSKNFDFFETTNFYIFLSFLSIFVCFLGTKSMNYQKIGQNKVNLAKKGGNSQPRPRVVSVELGLGLGSQVSVSVSVSSVRSRSRSRFFGRSRSTKKRLEIYSNPVLKNQLFFNFRRFSALFSNPVALQAEIMRNFFKNLRNLIFCPRKPRFA